MSITLTISATQHVKSMLEKRGKGLGLRLGTKMSGCSGYGYVVDYADEIKEDDQVFECNGVKVIVNSASLEVLKGMELDYVKNNVLNQGFEFNNPNVKNMCGCGESFTVD